MNTGVTKVNSARPERPTDRTELVDRLQAKLGDHADGLENVKAQLSKARAIIIDKDNQIDLLIKTLQEYFDDRANIIIDAMSETVEVRNRPNEDMPEKV